MDHDQWRHFEQFTKWLPIIYNLNDILSFDIAKDKISFLMKNKFQVLPFLFLGIFFIGTIWVQKGLVNERFPFSVSIPDCPLCTDDRGDEIWFLPVSSFLLGGVAPANPDFVSDLLWLRTAYYFGSQTLVKKELSDLPFLLGLITDLTPLWEYPFIFGAVVLPMEADLPDSGLFLISKGLKYHPNSWKLWFFKGYILWQYKNDFESASQAIFRASNMPGSPSYLSGLAVTFATNAGKKDLAAYFIKEALKSIEHPGQKQILLKKIKEMKGQ